MLISRAWLQTFFDKELPSAKELADGLTAHAFEIEEVKEVSGDSILDVKVLPNRAHDCLSHYGVAKEVAAIFSLDLARKPFTKVPQVFPESNAWSVDIETPKVKRFHGAVVRGVKVKASPKWLRERIEAMGGRSINNVVDITNFVMFDIGQPMHAFDAKKLSEKEGGYNFLVRESKEGEKTQTLDGAERVIPSGVLLITDGNTDGNTILGIGGIKGGMSSSITEETTDIILEAANFDAETIRRGSKLLDIRTDASKRFENGLAPELPGFAVAYAIELLEKEAKGDNFLVEGAVDFYPRVRKPFKIGVSLSETNNLLGTKLAGSEVEAILKRLQFEYEVVTNPVKKVLDLAPKYLDVPYKLGASISYDAPRLFDCSSYIAYLFSEAGVSLPRMSIDQYFFGEEITKEELQPGDIIFSSNHGKGGVPHHLEASIEFFKGKKVEGGIDHNGIYLGDGKVIYASGQWHMNKVVIEDLATSPSFDTIRGYRRMTLDSEPRYVVSVPFERLDLMAHTAFLVSGNKEDLIDEIGRIYGLEHIPSILPTIQHEVEVNKEFYFLDKVRSTLTAAGFSEVYTYAMVESGEVELQNPIAGDKNFMRASLIPGLTKSLDLNTYNAPALGLSVIKLFEIGKVFTEAGEHFALALAVAAPTLGKKRAEAERAMLTEVDALLKEQVGIEGVLAQSIVEIDLTPYIQKEMSMEATAFERSPEIVFKSFSSYPFILRDIAIFVPEAVASKEVLEIITLNAGEYFVRIDQFDEFRKEGKVSYAYHLVFQAMDKTLTDEEINSVMQKITDTLNANDNWQVR